MTTLHPQAIPDLLSSTPRGAAPVGSPGRPRAVQTTSVLAGIDLAVAAGAVVLLTGLGLSLPHRLLPAVPVLWLATLAAGKGYEGLRIPLGIRENTARVLRAAAWFSLACVGAATVIGVQPRPGPVLLVTAVLAGGSLAPRAGLGLLARRERGRAQRTRVVVAGHHADQVSRAVSELTGHPEHAFDVVLVCLARPGRQPVHGVPVTSGLHRLPEQVTGAGAEALIMLPCHHVDGEALRRLGWQLEDRDVALYVGTPLLDVAPARTSMARAGGLGLLHVRPSRLRGPARVAKGALEPLAATVLLVLLAPVLLALVCSVRRDSAGPALYRQTRVGRAGVPFTMYKLRTMSTDAEDHLLELTDLNTVDDVLFKAREDPRVTRLGRFLRRYSLDELPQLVNVALGQMSLVGPRPALPDEVVRYSPDALRRLAVKPGLTGLWQVSGRSDLSWADTVRLDLHYVDNWSPGLDLLILCRTVRAVLDHRGAY